MSTRYPFTPESAQFPTANAAALKKDPAGRYVLAFDASTKEGAYWQAITPQNFSSSPNLVAVVNYYMPNASGATNNVVWDVSIEAPAAGSTSVGTAAAWDANVTTSVSTIPASANTYKQHSITLNTIAALVAGGYFRMRLERNAAAAFDTASNDCHVMAVEFRDSV